MKGRSSMMNAIQENIQTSDPLLQKKESSEECLFYTRMDSETALLLYDIRRKFSKETNASILSKAIRYLHDQTCRTLIRNS
jgi:hypothetical protein